MNGLRFNAKLIVFIFAALLFSASAPVRAQHDMQNMPGMKMGNKSKGKSKFKAGSTRARIKSTKKRGGMTGMKMRGRSMPSASRASTRQIKSGPAKQMDMNMPGMQAPSSASPTTKQSSAP